MRGAAAFVAGCAVIVWAVSAGAQTVPGAQGVAGRQEAVADQSAEEGELAAFRGWLERERPGYGCDEGPARFQSKTVEAAYPGQRFYYVLTYTRGIPPPFKNATSVVVTVNDSGQVIPFRLGSLETYRRGLIRVRSAKDAKLAAAAVLIVGSCGESRWPYKPELFKAKKERKGWKCTYQHDKYHESWVTFDRKGVLAEVGGSAPPVP